jgi:hypothetical protein
MELFLTALSGIAWTIVYIVSIRIGFTQKTYAMPIAALGLNIAWEWIYSIYDLTSAPGPQAYINLVWALADVVILFTFFRYGRAEFPSFVTRPLFIAWGVAILGTSVAIQLLFIREFGLVDMRAAAYSAFLQNLLMSGLFIAIFGGAPGRARPVPHHRHRKVDRHPRPYAAARCHPEFTLHPGHRNPVQHF